MGPEASATVKLPTTETIVALLDAKSNDKTIKPYEEKAIATALLTNTPKSGKITSSTKNALLGTTELGLSNGVKVSLKSTDFKADQILFSGSRYGGLTNYALNDKYSAENAAMVVSSMGVGGFNPTLTGVEYAIVPAHDAIPMRYCDATVNDAAYVSVLAPTISVQDNPPSVDTCHW